tara:strand:+ start:908 stop:1624 length:717 start_codon:yes stop_codon:yes gene_type:complete
MFNNYSKKLTIIIPCYNEEKTIKIILEKIENLNNIKKQIIVVDDFSKDNSKKIIENFKFKSENKLIFHSQNKGKGSCIISSKPYITGDIVLIQDADLEYNPMNYYELLKPILSKETNVVYGSRVLGKKRYLKNSYSKKYLILANHFLTIFSNIINKQTLTDAHTCYKVINTDTFNRIILKEKGFAFCPEVTTKLSNLGEKIVEVPIDYNGRNYKEGKKIKLIDGIEAIVSILKYKYLT